MIDVMHWHRKTVHWWLQRLQCMSGSCLPPLTALMGLCCVDVACHAFLLLGNGFAGQFSGVLWLFVEDIRCKHLMVRCDGCGVPGVCCAQVQQGIVYLHDFFLLGHASLVLCL